MILEVQRAVYSSDNTPEDLREYKSAFSCAVGTKADWLEFAAKNGYEGVHFYDKNGSIESVGKVQK